MAGSGSLRGRITAAFALLAVTVCTAFAVLGYFGMQQVEKYLVAQRLETLAGWLVQQPQGLHTAAPPGIAIYPESEAPPALRALPAGFHEVRVGGEIWHVLKGRTPAAEAFIAVDEVSDFELVERQVLIGLGVCVLLSVLVGTALGRATAGRVIAPVTALAQAIGRGAQQEIITLMAREDEIGVLGHAFSSRTAELQRFLTSERLFTGDVSHELRTPLTVILGAAEVLSARLAERPDLHPPLERIQRTAHETAERVSALLMLSRSPDALDAPRQALGPLIERELERCKPLLHGKAVEIKVPPHPDVWVFARPELVGMAVGNLLRNACQHTERGQITVSLTPGSLSIEDTGPGLPPQVQAQLFERFVRGTAASDGGVGLGLSIVRRIVTHLGWEISVQAPPAGGSRFVLRFPVG